MRAVLIIPRGNQEGNLIWNIPYLYPEDQLEQGIESLRERSYIVDYLEDDVGLAFRSSFTSEDTINHFNSAFRWMDIVFHDEETQINLERDIFSHSLIVLPIARLRIEEAIVTETICLFPPGEFYIHNPYNLDGSPFENTDSISLRDFVTRATPIDISVFHDFPVIVFRKALTYEQYNILTQQDDVELIRECSDLADNLMNLVRFFKADYVLPDWLPAKPGIWNDRHSAMFTYFPGRKWGHILSREVELRGFIRGIGMDLYGADHISLHPLLFRDVTELGKLIKHALRLNTVIMETDDESMKFTQIFVLLEFLGDPFAFGRFQDMKKKLIPCLVHNQEEYEKMSKRFEELTNPGGIRTAIVHMGKRLQEIVPDSADRKKLFQELHKISYGLILHMMFSPAETWEDYEIERHTLRTKIFAAP